VKLKVINQLESIDDLAGLIEISSLSLLDIAEQPFRYYKKIIIKKGEKKRIVHEVLPPLKEIQAKIKTVFLDSVDYPDYLFGGIRGRGHIKDASYHLGAKVIIHEDVTKFFDHVNFAQVYYVWKDILGLPEDCSMVLTKLTTLENKLPQGASTSPLLSNLVLLRPEKDLVKKFQKMGLKYSRYIDDIQVSSNHSISTYEKRIIIQEIYVMLWKKGLSPNRKKHHIQNPQMKMDIHNITINSGQLTLGKKEYLKILSEIRKLESSIKEDTEYEIVKTKIRSVRGRISYYSFFHPNQSHNLFQKLDLIEKDYLQN
jgi:hypothetical protein